MPCRSSFHHLLVAMEGARRSTSRASASAAVRTSPNVQRRSMRTLMWTPREPDVLGNPRSPFSSNTSRAISATSRTCAQGTSGIGSRSTRSSSGCSRSSARTGWGFRSMQPGVLDHVAAEDIMPTFQYANPETIHWGKGCLREKLDGELRRVGARRVFLITTRSGQRDEALAPAIEKLLGDRLAGRFAGIGQHAPARSVMEAVHAAAEARADVLLSLGGGSPIDATKAVSFSLATGLDLTQPDAPARSRSMKVDRALPHLAVPTTLSVAELAASAGFSAEGTKEKVGVAAPQLKPAAVFYDAELAVRTPLPLWLTTGIRAIDHGVETLLAPGEHPP